MADDHHTRGADDVVRIRPYVSSDRDRCVAIAVDAWPVMSSGLPGGTASDFWSMLLDMVEPSPNTMIDIGFVIPGHHLVEDGPKLLGVVGLFIYFLRLCVAEVSAALGRTPSAQTPVQEASMR